MLVVLVMGTIVAFFIAGVAYRDNRWFIYVVAFLIGSLFLMGLMSEFDQNSGKPLTDIEAGVYQVALVYVAGDNVSVWIEKSKIDKETSLGGPLHLYFYQFPIDAFAGIDRKANQLMVSETMSGKFKKLYLWCKGQNGSVAK